VNQATKVLVVDDHTLFRKSLCSLLDREELVDIVGESDGLEALRQVMPTVADQVDVVLMDYHLGDGEPDGAEATEWLRDQFPGVPVIMLTMYDDREVLVRAAKSGAVGYVLKDSEVEDLVAAIKVAAQGKGYISPQMAEKAMAEMAKASLSQEAPTGYASPDSYGLTPREMEVLQRLVNGMTYGEVAKELAVSVSQIKQLAGSIFAKLGARDKAHAAAMAVARRLVPPPD